MFTSPSQILCTIFGVNIYYYGVIMALAIATGVLVADWAGTKYFGLKKETIIDLAPYIIIFGILGARIYYCALNYGISDRNNCNPPWRNFNTRCNAGRSFRIVAVCKKT